ncbi:MAG: hypothetical protein ACFFCZ_29850 [Promethearchaeota archaeon]
MKESNRIVRMEFSFFSPEEIINMAEIEITPEILSIEDLNGGFGDEFQVVRPRTNEIDQNCRICNNDDCPGHLGIVKLRLPVIHPAYTKIIYILLTVFCCSCNQLFLEETTINSILKKFEKKIEYRQKLPVKVVQTVIETARNNTECPHCGSQQPRIDFQEPWSFYEIRETTRERLFPLDIYRRLENIPNETIPLIGLNYNTSRPEGMILRVIPIPPVAVRQLTSSASPTQIEDDIAHKLTDVIRINQRLKECIEAGAPHLIIEDLWELLQYHVATYIDNELPGIPPARARNDTLLRALKNNLKDSVSAFHAKISERGDQMPTLESYLQKIKEWDLDNLGRELIVAESFIQKNDKTLTYICVACGQIADHNPQERGLTCNICQTDVALVKIDISHELKGILQDLQLLLIRPMLGLCQPYSFCPLCGSNKMILNWKEQIRRIQFYCLDCSNTV